MSGGAPPDPAPVGILCWEAGRIPRGLECLEALPGNSTNRETYGVPVLLRRVPGANCETILKRPDPAVADRMVEEGRALVGEGARLVTTSCGFNAILQRRLAEALPVPVLTSALLQVPWIRSLLGPGARIGILTADGGSLTAEHRAAAGIDPATPLRVDGLEGCAEWGKIFREPEAEVDPERVREEVLGVALRAVRESPDLRAFVLECTDLPPFAPAIRSATGRPVFDFVSMVRWAWGPSPPAPAGSRTFPDPKGAREHMKRILVFGAGRVARPCVRHLLERGYAVTAADLSEANLEQVLGGHPNGRAIRADAGREAEAILRAEHPDLVICLLPPALMAPVARLCLDARVPLVHPAYLDEAQRALAGAVRAAGLVFLPELGLDPGIDHMSAARTVHRVRERGWRVESFRSVCGALPAPEANTNPWGYKLSWAPASLIGASLREARILREGREVVLPDGETYRHPELEEIEGMGWYEVYANGNALPYREAYGIPEARSLFRGTLRYLGWSETICGLNALSLVSEAPEDLRGLTFRGFLARRLGVPGPEVEEALCRRLGIPPHSAVLMRLRWLGLLEEEPVPEGMGCARDLVALLFDRKLGLDPGERDLVILRDEFLLRDPSGGRHRIRSTLVDFGDPGGDTSIARTTGLPPAVGADLILRGEIRTPGLHAPVLREVWEPLLAELEERGIRLKEEETELPG